ncbi:MAG TPA: BTAD domain-containing putative transcriptional regulator, partial [Pseudonocardiaceae bacterium]|nr:BTAD domain-containing putative transcriptional regulator [Pseudonocardiaceae bacterium]
MDFRILGPLEVTENGRTLHLGAAKQRTLLGVLLLHLNRVVSATRLVDELWGESPPASASKAIQGYVLGLRKVLGGAIVTKARGYLLQAEPDRLDLVRFERLAAEGQACLRDDPEQAAERFGAALRLWRGDPLEGLVFGSLARHEVERLSEQRLAVLEQRIEADLALGRHVELVGRLQELVAEHPYRERVRAHLMLALYRSGRQAEALSVYRDTRRLLAAELGLEPGRELQELERRMLVHAGDLDLPAPATLPSVPTCAPEPTRGSTTSARRLVSIVFAGLSGAAVLAERLDPESMHVVHDRFFEICAEVLERHGGGVEQFVGDVAFGAFGLAELHEDDAMRAVRAAVELRDAVAVLSAELERAHRLRIGVRVGINSGEVFVGAGAGRDRFASGDAINVAARLGEAAAEGDIVLGERTFRLVESEVCADARAPLIVRGRVAMLRAWRLRELVAEKPWRSGPPATLFVGREQELCQLRAVFTQAATESTCCLVTVLGPPGIGKSRLVRELAAEVSDNTTVLIGRCLAYGEGIAYRPLAEIVGQLTGEDPRQRLGEFLEGEPKADQITQRILGALGLSDETTQPEETFWAVRRLFERLAATRQLMVIVEDVHWAEPILIDLLDHVVSFSVGAPIVVVCLARPEFLESRPAWAVVQPNRSVLSLPPLSEAASHQLVESLPEHGADQSTIARAVRVAEGNPLFLEQLVAVYAESEQPGLPPSIQALLAARIERLEPGEQAVLQYASIAGRNFHRAALDELLPDSERPHLGTYLVSLIRKQLVRSERSEFLGEDAFRFAHALIREATYESLPKVLRAELHQRVADWLDMKPAAEAAVIGYHLEQAYWYWAQLGRVGDRERELAAHASERLVAAARTTLNRGDVSASARLLERATALLAVDDPARSALLPRLGDALMEAGRFVEAERVLAEAVERARIEADPRLDALARVEQQRLRLQTNSSWCVADSRGVAEAALRVLAEYDDLGRCRAWHLRACIAWIEGLVAAADQAWQCAAEHARRADEERELFEILGWRASAAAFGPMPVAAAIRRCDEIREQVSSSPVAVALTLHPLGLLYAMRGDFGGARRLILTANEILDGLGRMQSAVSHHECLVEMLAGRPTVAEQRLRRGYQKLKEMGEMSLFGTTSAMLAQAL